jgi:tRNA threonylcarbamoyladenosine biosynthesis protein TsaB
LSAAGLLLALETAGPEIGVALLEGEHLLGERSLGAAARHDAELLPAIDLLLRACGARLEAVAALGLSVGPGSFTGLRVGLATALGLCFGTQRPIVPVPTLQALSLHAEGASCIAPALDARQGLVYGGLYGPGGAPLREDCASEPLAWLDSLRSAGKVCLLGSGADLCAELIRARLGARATLLPAALGVPRASTVGRLAARLWLEGRELPPQQVRLRYLRAPALRGPVLDTPGRNP